MENEWRAKWVPQLSNVCTVYPVWEHSVFPHPFNDDLGEYCSPLRGIRVQMNLQTTY